MTDVIQLVTIQLRQGTQTLWAQKNPILNNGEPGYETDTGRFKVGDGSTTWLALDYFLDASGVQSLIEAVVSAQVPAAVASAVAELDLQPAGVDIDPAYEGLRQHFGPAPLPPADTMPNTLYTVLPPQTP